MLVELLDGRLEDLRIEAAELAEWLDLRATGSDIGSKPKVIIDIGIGDVRSRGNELGPAGILLTEPAVKEQVGRLPRLAGHGDFSFRPGQLVDEPLSPGVHQDGPVLEESVLRVLPGHQQ